MQTKGAAYDYLVSRGLDNKDIDEWLIGYNGERIVFPFKDKANKEHNVYYVTKDKGQNPPEYNIETVPFFFLFKDEDGNTCAYK